MTNESSTGSVVFVSDGAHRCGEDEAPRGVRPWAAEQPGERDLSGERAVVSASTAPDAGWPTPYHVGRLVRAGLLAVVAAVVINILVFVIVREVLETVFVAPVRGPAAEPGPRAVAHVVIVSAVPAPAAAALLGLIARPARRPGRAFVTVAAVVAVLSLGVPLSLDGVSSSTRIALIVMCLIATAVSLGVLGAAALGPPRAGAAARWPDA